MAVLKDQDKVLAYEHLGDLTSKKVLIVATEWNAEIIEKQLEGAERIAKELNITTDLMYVPGAIEIPYGVKTGLKRKDYDAVIAFGAVIRGGTPHFDYVCKFVTEGILALNLDLDTPIVYGVLTLDTVEQAWERLGGEHGHKGEEAMITAAKMIQL